MEKPIIFATVLLFSLVSLFSFVLIRPTANFAAASCSFSITDTEVSFKATIYIPLHGPTGDYRLLIESVNGNQSYEDELEKVTSGTQTFPRNTSKFTFVKENSQFTVKVSGPVGDETPTCDPTAGIVVTVGSMAEEPEEPPPDPNAPRFTEPPDVLNYGFTTLDLVQVMKLPVMNDNNGNSAVWKFKLGGMWDGWLREKGGDDKFADLIGTVNIRSICTNGEAKRNDCADNFQLGKYTIDVVPAHDENNIIASYKFNVVVALTPEPDDVTFGDPNETTIDTPFGTITLSADDPGSGVAQAVLNVAIGIAGGIAFLMMIFGAYRLIFAAGNPESIQQGQQIITAAIAGLLVIIFAVAIMNFLGFTLFGLSI